MTRKHYREIAKIINDFHNKKINLIGVVSRLSFFMGEDNPNFDGRKFFEACFEVHREEEEAA